MSAKDLDSRKQCSEELIERDQPQERAKSLSVAQDEDIQEAGDQQLATAEQRRRRILRRNVEQRRGCLRKEHDHDRDKEIDERADDERDAQDVCAHQASVTSGAFASTVSPTSATTAAIEPERCARISFIIFIASITATT